MERQEEIRRKLDEQIETHFEEDFSEVVNDLSQDEIEQLLFEVGNYETRPVDINTFIDSPEYLGGYFDGIDFNPYWRKVLNEIFPSPFLSQVWLITLGGAIGIGKTTTAAVGIAYEAYLLQCLKNPQKESGLVESTKLLFALFNVTLGLASDIWDKLTQMFAISPYFSRIVNVTPSGRKRDDCLFPKRIDFFQGSRIGHSLGRAVYSAILDESDFEVQAGQVYKNFNSILRRMESRFTSPGLRFPGKIWIVSSESDRASTINRIIAQYSKATGVLIKKAALWDVYPQRYCGKTFPVYKGSQEREPLVLQHDDKLILMEPNNIIWAPVEHQESFEASVGDSLRDLAGVPVISKYRLFASVEKLNKAMSITSIFDRPFRLEFMDDSDVVQNHAKHPGYFNNPFRPEMPRHIHIDIALNGDRLGFASSFVNGFIERQTKDPLTLESTYEAVPTVVTEFAFAVEAVPGQQIPLFRIRAFVQWLVEKGLPISEITCDGYQSADMLQMFMRMGFMTDVYSVDKTSIPYVTFRAAVYEGRHNMPNDALLRKELENLEMTPDGKKVDHPDLQNIDGSRPSKDEADGVCGSMNRALARADDYRLLFYEESSDHPAMSDKLTEQFWGRRALPGWRDTEG